MQLVEQLSAVDGKMLNDSPVSGSESGEIERGAVAVGISDAAGVPMVQTHRNILDRFARINMEVRRADRRGSSADPHRVGEQYEFRRMFQDADPVVLDRPLLFGHGERGPETIEEVRQRRGVSRIHQLHHPVTDHRAVVVVRRTFFIPVRLLRAHHQPDARRRIRRINRKILLEHQYLHEVN